MASILVVEDSETDWEVIKASLKREGYTAVTRAKSAEEADTKLSQSKPDLVILDVLLGGRTGFEMCRELKTNEATKAIPVIICSSKNTSVDKTWGDMLGANAYLTKPVDQQLLGETLRKLL